MDKRVYIYLKDEETAIRFRREAETGDFAFTDSAKPTEWHWSDVYAIHSDGMLNYVSAIVHIE